ncbi:MAG TPA: diguanylate cyclase, partial [Nitrospiria bacterium]
MAKGKILLIEDNPLQAKQTRALVESAGYTVIVAETGGTGFKLTRTELPDLVLLDVVLPDFTGDQICQWIKKEEVTRAIPVIMLTAKASLEDRVAGLEVGADDYLPKPFDDKELLARIQACLRSKVMRDELRGRNDQLETLLKDVEQKASTDAVTGLHTRRHFNELLDKEYSRAVRYSEPITCLMIDIDHFKEINDTLGHPVGDLVLAEIGMILKQSVRLIEVAARYGGEEFVMLLPKTPVREA